MRDRVVPVRRQMRLFEAIPDAEAFRVDGDHDAVVANAEQFVPTLLRACRSVVERVAMRSELGADRQCRESVRAVRGVVATCAAGAQSRTSPASACRSVAPTPRRRRASCSPPPSVASSSTMNVSCAPPRPSPSGSVNMKGALMKLGQMASYVDEGCRPDARRARRAAVASAADERRARRRGDRTRARRSARQAVRRVGSAADRGGQHRSGASRRRRRPGNRRASEPSPSRCSTRAWTRRSPPTSQRRPDRHPAASRASAGSTRTTWSPRSGTA